MKRNETVELTVESLAFGGEAIARGSDGRVVFLSGGPEAGSGSPGDRVAVRLDEVKARFARGTIARLVEGGACRVAARCPLSGSCGGCQWQETALDAQRAAKQAILERALGRLGAEVRPLLSPSEGFHYRWRARLTVGAAGEIGYQARRTHTVIDVPACPLLEPALDEALRRARAVLAPQLVAGATLSGLAGRDGAVQLSVALPARPSLPGRDRAHGDGEARAREALWTALKSLLDPGSVVGVQLRDGDGATVSAGQPEVDLADAGEPPHWAAADGFAQAGRDGNRALRELVRAELGRGDRALELHAGDGNFTRDLARAFAEVLAVEGDAAAVARLRRNLPRDSSATALAGAARVTAVAEPVERSVARLVSAGERFDAVLLDPPRAGAAAVLSSLARLTDRIVYVSCDPMTLARDAAALAALGLPPLRATGLDLMPQTYHLETVCLFTRR